MWPCRYIYRRIHPDYIDKPTGRPLPSAFELKPNERGLSVIQDDDVPPKQAFIQCLATLSSDRKAAFYKQHGSSPLELYEHGWRVAKLPLALFVSELSDQPLVSCSDIDELRHFQLFADKSVFADKSGHLALNCEVIEGRHWFEGPS